MITFNELITQFGCGYMHDGDSPLNIATHKIYPFWSYQIVDFRREETHLFCDDCGHEFDRFCHYIKCGRSWVVFIFQSPAMIETLCDLCFKNRGRADLMKWENQRHGHKEPIKFPEKYNGDELMETVWSCFFGFDRAYMAKSFPDGITKWKQIGCDFHNFSGNGTWCFNGRKWMLSKNFGRDKSAEFTSAQAMELVNKIILNQDSKPLMAGTQLSLF